MKTLIIDDEPSAREKLKKLLKKLYPKLIKLIEEESGMAKKVMCAEDGINMIKKHKPDLIFLDIHLGDMDAFQMLDELERKHGLSFLDFHVIFFTQFKGAENLIKAYERSGIPYLEKPIKEDKLKLEIERVKNFPKFSTTKPILITNLGTNYTNKKIGFESSKEYEFIRLSDIVYFGKGLRNDKGENEQQSLTSKKANSSQATEKLFTQLPEELAPSPNRNELTIGLKNNKRKYYRATITRIDKILPNDGIFWKIGQSVIINSTYMTKVINPKSRKPLIILELENNSTIKFEITNKSDFDKYFKAG